MPTAGTVNPVPAAVPGVQSTSGQAQANTQKGFSDPVLVAEGVVQQTKGNKVYTSSAQAIDPVTGRAQLLPNIPELPHFTSKDFQSNQKVVQVAPEVKSSWTKPKTVQITAVKDGDTLDGKYEDGSGNVVCRVTSIDAPETGKKDVPGQKYGKYSVSTIEKLIKDKKIEVQVSTVPGDKSYGRDLCLITVNGDNLSTAMVEAGAAYIYEKYAKPELIGDLRKAEEKSRKNKSGVWQSPNEERPWDFRRRISNTAK